MTLDEAILREATELRDRLLELQHEADRTRVDYQHVIRRLHAAGGSLREIAEALGLSHQRVHQIVEHDVVAPPYARHGVPRIPRPRAAPGRRGLERFTRAARASVALAQEEAEALGHEYIGTEHLLLGLVRAERGGAARVLTDVGVTLERAREETARASGEREQDVERGRLGRRMPFTPRAKRALENALQEARARQHGRIGTEHMLLALVADEESLAREILGALGVAGPAVAERVERLFAS